MDILINQNHVKHFKAIIKDTKHKSQILDTDQNIN